MVSSEDSEQQSPSQQAVENTTTAPWRKRRIVAGILTILIGFNTANILLTIANISQNYKFMQGMALMPFGQGGPSLQTIIPLPSIVILLTLLIGGLIYCGKRGRARFIVWFAALVNVPVSIWKIYLTDFSVPLPGRPLPEPDYFSLMISLVISIYLIWVLIKTTQKKHTIRSKIIGATVTIVPLVLFMIYASSSFDQNFKKDMKTQEASQVQEVWKPQKDWKPSTTLAGLSIGMTKEEVHTIKGQPYSCYENENACSWHFRSSKRSDLTVYYNEGLVSKIRLSDLNTDLSGGNCRCKIAKVCNPRSCSGNTGKISFPFSTVDQMHQTLGEEDILSEKAIYSMHTYPDVGVSFQWLRGVIQSVSIGDEDWWNYRYSSREKKLLSYFVQGRQLCPGEACPWDNETNLKPEYEKSSYRDFIDPSPELEKFLAESLENVRKQAKKAAEDNLNKRYKQKAEQGDANAQYQIGEFYYRESNNWDHTPHDFKEAEKWYSLASEQGHKEAIFKLGKMNEEGLGIPQDYSKAIERYQLAAEKKYPTAQSRLGSMYMEGKGVSKDNVIAYMWFQLSAMSDKSARTNLKVLANSMTEDEKVKSTAMVNDWRKKHQFKKKVDQ